MDWNNATPEQISDAVFNAVKNNMDAAPEVTLAGLEAAAGSGRWNRTGSEDGKQSVDPDGSSGDPGFEDIANVISDAAKRANPAMAPQIDAAVAGAMPGLLAGLGSPGGDPGGGGGGGGSSSSTGDS